MSVTDWTDNFGFVFALHESKGKKRLNADNCECLLIKTNDLLIDTKNAAYTIIDLHSSSKL